MICHVWCQLREYNNLLTSDDKAFAFITDQAEIYLYIVFPRFPHLFVNIPLPNLVRPSKSSGRVFLKKMLSHVRQMLTYTLFTFMHTMTSIEAYHESLSYVLSYKYIFIQR